MEEREHFASQTRGQAQTRKDRGVARPRSLVRISPWAQAVEPRGPGHSIGDSANPREAHSSRHRDHNPSKGAGVGVGYRASCAALRSLAFPSSAAGDDAGDGRLSRSIAPPGRAPQSSRLATIDFPAAPRTRGFRCVARAGPARRHSEPGCWLILQARTSCSLSNSDDKRKALSM